MNDLRPEQLIYIAGQHMREGRINEARDLCAGVLNKNPKNAEALMLRGQIAQHDGALDTAYIFLQRALRQLPQHASLLNVFGKVCWQLGRHKEARRALEQSLQLSPDAYEALRDYARVLAEDSCDEKLAGIYRRLLAQHPDDLEVLVQFGCLLESNEKFDEAADYGRRALQIDPRHHQALQLLGHVELARGHHAEALTCYRQAEAIDPHDARTQVFLGQALLDCGYADDAVAAFGRALKISSHDESIQKLIGSRVRRNNVIEAMADHYRKMLAENPQNAESHFGLGLIYMRQRNVDACIEEYRKAVELAPDHSSALHNLGMAYKDRGELAPAIACFRKVAAMNDNACYGHGSLIYTLHFDPACSEEELFAEHRRWDERFAAHLGLALRPHDNEPIPERRIKIGYVSPNFSMHPVGRFMTSLFRAHDHDQFEICCYSDTRFADDVTRQIRAHADVWVECADMNDEQLAARIRRDKVDILVDLTMHMASNRMLMFARKPAPVQMTYLAYCSTTGLSAIDYRITDPHLDPPERSDMYYTEKSLRLPTTYWCYEPAIKNVDVNALPADQNGYVTFASLNNFCKVAPHTLTIWSQIMAAVPNSRMIMFCLAGNTRTRVENIFAQAGVAAERLRFFDIVSLQHFFRLLHAVDIALDPFPYPGGTTTCDALWMGVPTVSLAGHAAWTRSGLSIMRNIGLPELATFSEEEYLHRAITLATDLPRLAQLRATMRNRLNQSPLMNEQQFARDVEGLFRNAWEKWCEKQ